MRATISVLLLLLAGCARSLPPAASVVHRRLNHLHCRAEPSAGVPASAPSPHATTPTAGCRGRVPARSARAPTPTAAPGESGCLAKPRATGRAGRLGRRWSLAPCGWFRTSRLGHRLDHRSQRRRHLAKHRRRRQMADRVPSGDRPAQYPEPRSFWMRPRLARDGARAGVAAKPVPSGTVERTEDGGTVAAKPTAATAEWWAGLARLHRRSARLVYGKPWRIRRLDGRRDLRNLRRRSALGQCFDDWRHRLTIHPSGLPVFCNKTGLSFADLTPAGRLPIARGRCVFYTTHDGGRTWQDETLRRPLDEAAFSFRRLRDDPAGHFSWFPRWPCSGFSRQGTNLALLHPRRRADMARLTAVPNATLRPPIFVSPQDGWTTDESQHFSHPRWRSHLVGGGSPPWLALPGHAGSFDLITVGPGGRGSLRDP